MVTMLDVAKRAGVSKSTVSRVLNGQNVVRPEVVALVFKAIEETGYRPNLLARQLATNKTNSIGFVITNALYDGPYFSRLVYHAASFSEKNGHQLVLTDGKHSAEDERNAINFLLDMKCTGIVVYPQYLNTGELAEIIDHASAPIIVINRQIESHASQTVTTDHYQSAAMLMDYIFAQGHRQVAFIRGKAHSSTDQQRFHAYQDKLKQQGIVFDANKVVDGDWTPESGYLAAKTLIGRQANMTAVIAGNDEMALGAMKCFFELGYRVPQDISVAGFDNIKMGDFVTPPLTSVSVPLEQMIKKGVMLVLGQIEQAENLNIESSLVIRESVAKTTSVQ